MSTATVHCVSCAYGHVIACRDVVHKHEHNRADGKIHLRQDSWRVLGALWSLLRQVGQGQAEGQGEGQAQQQLQGLA